jgi:hypothetical protein
MKIGGKNVTWNIEETEDFYPLHDYMKPKVDVLRIYINNKLTLVIKINDRGARSQSLGPGLFVNEYSELNIGIEQIEKSFFIRPKLTRISCLGVGNYEVNRIIQWLHSKRFKFIESFYFNFPKAIYME